MKMFNPQVVLLCAGKSSRFHPFSSQRHKSMIRLAGKPILYYTIESLKQCGLTDIIIVLGPPETGTKEINTYFSSGKSFGVSIRYVYEKEQLGMGQALLAAHSLINRPFFVLNPYHSNAAQFISPMLASFQPTLGGVLLIKKTTTPEHYGIALVQDTYIKKIIEKPEPGSISSNKKVVGIYLLQPSYFTTLEQTPLCDCQFETALNLYLTKHPLLFHETTAISFSLKYPWDLFPLKQNLLDHQVPSISPQASVHKTALIEGKVVIEPHATIGEHAIIKGPAYIGPYASVGSHSLIRDYVALEEKSSIGCFSEIKNTLLGRESSIHSGFIGDSLIGENCHLGADFLTANKRLDRQPITTIVKGNKVNTQRKALGTIMGDHCQIGIRVSTMPGVIISPQAIVPPSTTIYTNH